MSRQNEWEYFFDRHAPKYMEEPFTANTAEEVEFILEELNLPQGSRILDVGCGTGRHSIRLSQRGFKMTGIDISKGMLDEARRGAEKMGVDLDLIHADAVDFVAESKHDAAICLCEGALGLVGSGEDAHQRDLRILQNISQSIEENGKFILTVPNGMRTIRAASKASVSDGSFDPLTLTEVFELNVEGGEISERVTVRERGFVPSELVLMLGVAGFGVEGVWGGTAGNWKRAPVNLDEMEIMAIARKASSEID